MMGFFRSIFGQGANSTETIHHFQKQIEIQREQLFGITLFLQGLEVMYSDQPEILEMNRQALQNIVSRTESAISAAESLIKKTKIGPTRLKQIRRFKFPPIKGNPILDQLSQRAQVLVSTYRQVFPNRSQSVPLRIDEMKRLMAAVELE